LRGRFAGTACEQKTRRAGKIFSAPHYFIGE
jgi:hypothetical protein